MSNSIPIFYINLETRADRRTFMEEQFTRLKLSATRIVASEPGDLDAQTLNNYCDPAAAYVLSPQQLCCSISHTRAWKQLLVSGAPRALILEDDVIFSEMLPDFLRQLPSLPFDIIKMGTPLRTLLVAPPLNTEPIMGVSFRKFHSTGWGSGAYLITAKAAKKLLASPSLFNLPADAMLFCPLEEPARNLELVQADPAPCIQLIVQQQFKKIASIDPSAQITSSNIVSFLQPTSWLGRTTRWRRQIRWGVIKLWQMIARPDLSRKKIPFMDSETNETG